MRKWGYLVLFISGLALASLVHTALFWADHGMFKSSFFVVHLWRLLPVVFGLLTGIAMVANGKSALWAWFGVVTGLITTWIAWKGGVFSVAWLGTLGIAWQELLHAQLVFVDEVAVPILGPLLLVASLYRLQAIGRRDTLNGVQKTVADG